MGNGLLELGAAWLVLCSVFVGACSNDDPSAAASAGSGGLAAGASCGTPSNCGDSSAGTSSGGSGGTFEEAGAAGKAGAASGGAAAGSGGAAAGSGGAAAGSGGAAAGSGGAAAGAGGAAAGSGGAAAGSGGAAAGSGGVPNVPRACGSPSVAALNAGKTFNSGTGYFEGGTKLLDFGRSSAPIFQRGDRVVTQPSYGATSGWILWDTVSGNQLTRGSSGTSIDAAGAVFVVTNPFASLSEIRALSDGHVVGTLNGAVYGLASDGSYVWGRDGAVVNVWDLSGTLKQAFSVPLWGRAFAAPNELRILVGQNVRYLNVTTGAQTVSSAAFTGGDRAWFADGSHFLTSALNQVVRIYTPDAVLAGTVNLPDHGELGGYGNYFWSSASGSVYSIGANPNVPVPLATWPVPGSWFQSGSMVMAPLNSNELKLVRLEGVLSSETFPLPASWYSTATAFAADTSGRWSAIGSGGLIYHHGTVSDPNASGFLGCGSPLDVTGSQSGLTAVATDAGIVLMNTTSQVVQQVVSTVRRNHLALSDAGTLLVAGGGPSGLDVFSLPGTTPYSWPVTRDFRLSRGGTRLSQSCSNLVTDPTGGNEIALVPQSNCSAPRLSPSGANIAVSDIDPAVYSAMDAYPTKLPRTSIYQGAALTNIVPGFAVGWIDDNSLLVQTYTFGPIRLWPEWTYESSHVYDKHGTLVASLSALPMLVDFDTISSTRIMSTYSGTVYDVTTGAVVGTNMGETEGLPRRFAHAGTSIVETADGIYITSD